MGRKKAILSTILIIPVVGFQLLCTGCAKEAANPTNSSDLSLEATEIVTEAESADTTQTTETGTEAEEEQRMVITGDARFEDYIPLLEGKRVALYTNQTGIVEDGISRDNVLTDMDFADSSVDPNYSLKDESGGTHILDALLARGMDVRYVLSPEHGFRGTADAGEAVDSSVDAKTGVPIVSLYGGQGLTADVLGTMDLLVVDIQDVGLRFYTYYITMYHLMERCAQAGIPVIVLDRPNPNGSVVDGPILQDGYTSGVGALPIPILHGLTLGELAQMINGEGWLATGKDSCDLTVIPCLNYTRNTRYLPEVKPSPNLKSIRGIYLYPSTCLFENTVISVGRGTEAPFEQYGSPLLSGAEGYTDTFTPQSMPGATNPQYLGEPCYGKDLRTESYASLWDKGVDLSYVVDAYHAVERVSPGSGFFGTPDGSGRYWIDLLTGSNRVRTMIEQGATAEEIEETWKQDVEAFVIQSEPYRLYE